MIKVRNILFLLFVWSQIDGARDAQWAGHIDPELKPYVEFFYRTMEKELETPRSEFAPITRMELVPGLRARSVGTNTIGICMTEGNTLWGHLLNYQYIILDREYWNQSDEFHRVMLVVHEMGHCALWIEAHDAEPDHIMSTRQPAYQLALPFKDEIARFASLYYWYNQPPAY